MAFFNNAEDRTDVIALAVGVWAAAPGAANLSELAEFFNNGGDLESLTEELTNSAIFEEEYPNTLTNEEFATRFVDNAVGDLVSDDNKEWAVDQLTSQLSAGDSLADVILGALDTLQAVPADDENWGNASVAFDNKVEVAEYFSVELGKNGASMDDLKAVIAGVDQTDESVEEAKEVADGTTSEEGQTFTLTDELDTFTGGSNDDVFNAPLTGDQSAPDQTLGLADELDGGAGTDRLNATLNDDVGGANGGSPALTSIERVWLRSRHDDAEVDLGSADSVEQLWNDRSTNDLTVTGVQNSVVLGLNNVAGGTYGVTFDDNSATQDVVLQGADDVTLSVTGDTTVTDLNLNAASGDNELTLDGDLDSTENLTITGSADLAVETNTAGFEDIVTVAAGSYSGDLELDLSEADLSNEEFSVVLGDGDDTLTIDGSVAGNEDASIDLGAGENTLNVGALEALDLSDIEIVEDSVQVLEFGNSTEADLDLDGWGSVDTLSFAGTLTLGADMALDNAPEELAVTFGAAASGAFAIDFGDVETLSLTSSFTAPTTAGTVDDLTVTGESLTDVTVNALTGFGGNGAVTFAGDATEEWSLSSLTLNDLNSLISGDGTDFDIILDDTVELTEIDASNTNIATTATINASDADFADSVTVNIGRMGFDDEGELDGDGFAYTAETDGDAREAFTFVGEDIGDVEITGFSAGVLGSNDRLDFSQFDGVDDLDDLNVTDDGAGNYEITSDAFSGTITLTGTSGDPTDDSANFVF